MNTIESNIKKTFNERRKTKEKKGTQKIEVQNYMIPRGAKLVECYLTATEVLVIDDIDTEDETHNCDMLGCGSLSHVKYRFNLKDSYQNKI